MQAPKFWDKKTSKLSKFLNPCAVIYAWIVAKRLANKHPYQAKMPVICVGNISIGGTGKTPVCIALAELLKAHQKTPWFLNHGYHAAQQSVFVDVKTHSALDVGDEALLLATTAPTIVDSARARGAQLAEKMNAPLLIMDDGFQNPTLVKTFSFVVADGVKGFGNERVLPAGPLREPILKGLKRADALILVGNDTWGVRKYLKENKIDLPILTGQFVPNKDDLKKLQGKAVCAFAGLGNPKKFFDMLTMEGIQLVQTQNFPDHYFYTRFDIEDLKKKNSNAVLATTSKDWVKIPAEMRSGLVEIRGHFEFNDPEKIWSLLKESL